MKRQPKGIVIQGRVLKVRNLGGIVFIQILSNNVELSLVCEQNSTELEEFNKVKQIKNGDHCSLLTWYSGNQLQIIQVCNHIKRNQDSLWTNKQIGIIRAYSYLLSLLRQYSVSNGYTEVRLPTVHYGQEKTEVFSLDFFQQPARLTSSNALFLNLYATQLSKAFSLQKCFRAEPSHTNRHLAEFDLFEVAMVNYDLSCCMVELESLVKFIVFEFTKSEFRHLVQVDTDLILQSTFPIIEYKQLQEKYNLENKGLGKYDREIATSLPTFVIHFPRRISSWMAKPLDACYTLSFNLLVPKIGEVAEGNVKQTSRELLFKKFELANVKTQLGWYTQMMPYSDFPLTGFGLGVERLLMWIIGLKNIRLIHPIYRDKRFSEISDLRNGDRE